MAEEYVFKQEELDKMLDDALTTVEKRAGDQAPQGQQSLKDRLMVMARERQTSPAPEGEMPL